MVPCSNGGRGLTIGYVFIGLPCMLIFLNKVSKTLLAFVHWLDIMLNRWRRKKDINPKPNIMLGMVIAIMWILIFAATVYHVDSYFTQSATENYFGAFYFIIITLTTIGLGDIDFKDRHLAVAYFAMVFMGRQVECLIIKFMKIYDFCVSLLNYYYFIIIILPKKLFIFLSNIPLQYSSYSLKLFKAMRWYQWFCSYFKRKWRKFCKR